MDSAHTALSIVRTGMGINIAGRVADLGSEGNVSLTMPSALSVTATRWSMQSADSYRVYVTAHSKNRKSNGPSGSLAAAGCSRQLPI